VHGLDGGAKPPPQNAATGDAAVAALVPLPPGEECANGCRLAYKSCSAACENDAGSDAACRSCDPDFRSCMRRCFK
jgi:hypothetical protein